MRSRKQLIVRHTLTDSEEMRIKMYLTAGGFYYKVIAQRVWGRGDPRYVPSKAEVARVGKIARQCGMSSRDWRNGELVAAQRLLNSLGRSPLKSKPKLRVVA